MIDNHLLEVQTLLRNNGILISFSGWLSQQLIEEYGEAIRKYLVAENKPKNEISHIFSIYIEQTQNINNYCATKSVLPVCDRISQSSIVTIGKTEQGTYICSGNLVENDDLNSLIARVESVVKLDKDGLKRAYKEQLKKELPDGANGAGVGLIDMARKATMPLEYSVTKVDELLSFFILKAVV